MILGALVDLGLPLAELAGDLAKLSCGVRLRAESVTRSGIHATKVHVDTPDEPQPHRGLKETTDIIGDSALSQRTKERAIRIFARLAEVEAGVHGVGVEDIRFHEIGALDSIADIVGAVCGIERLEVSCMRFSTLRLGGGTVQAAHGSLPVPAPATAELVAGFACEMGPVNVELLTPTAAAILTTLGEQQDPGRIRIEKTGYGAGDRDLPGHPNVLRAFLGTAVGDVENDSVWVVEANLDDATPEICGHAIERLLAAGALDAYVIPIQMKKSRPAVMLCAIAEAETLVCIEDIFFRETTTFGLRRYLTARTRLARETVSVETPYGTVRMKVGKRQGETVTVSPEFEDCRRIAIEQNLPLREIINLAQQTFHEKKKPSRP